MSDETKVEPAVFRLHYISRRAEIWWWYCRSWRQRLWKVHLRVFLLSSLAIGIIAAHQRASTLEAASVSIASGLIAISWFPLYPLLKFKPQMRALEVGVEGIATTIGDIAAKRSWAEIQAVDYENNYVIITGRNGNAFIIPPRAFKSGEEAENLLAFARRALETPTA